MNGEQHPSPRQPPSLQAGTDPPPATIPGADPPVLWAEFGQQVLAAHHRNGLGAQCVCGSLMYYCPVIAAAQHHGLPTDDPLARAGTSPSRTSRQNRAAQDEAR